MKTLLTAAALAIAFLAPAAEARMAGHQDTPHASAAAKTTAARKSAKAKHRKSVKKSSHQAR